MQSEVSKIFNNCSFPCLLGKLGSLGDFSLIKFYDRYLIK